MGDLPCVATPGAGWAGELLSNSRSDSAAHREVPAKAGINCGAGTRVKIVHRLEIGEWLMVACLYNYLIPNGMVDILRNRRTRVGTAEWRFRH